jgi:hypothetical protein
MDRIIKAEMDASIVCRRIGSEENQAGSVPAKRDGSIGNRKLCCQNERHRWTAADGENNSSWLLGKQTNWIYV